MRMVTELDKATSHVHLDPSILLLQGMCCFELLYMCQLLTSCMHGIPTQFLKEQLAI